MTVFLRDKSDQMKYPFLFIIPEIMQSGNKRSKEDCKNIKIRTFKNKTDSYLFQKQHTKK